MDIRNMRKLGISALGIASVLALAGCGGGGSEAADSNGDNIARTMLVGADQVQYGEVIVGQDEGGLIVRINAEGLSPGQHGVHIHEIGKCEGPDFKTAGGHWNPTQKQHGFDNPDGAHMGDFFNLDVGEDGKGALEAKVAGGTLQAMSGEDSGSALLDDDGAAFIVHAGPDDLQTDPSGESGGRIACGVFDLQEFKPIE